MSPSYLDFSPDGKRLASVGGDRRLILWDVASGKEILRRELGSKNMPWRVYWTADGRHLLTNESTDIVNQQIRLWDVERMLAMEK